VCVCVCVCLVIGPVLSDFLVAGKKSNKYNVYIQHFKKGSEITAGPKRKQKRSLEEVTQPLLSYVRWGSYRA
jgi:hypothetical protein